MSIIALGQLRGSADLGRGWLVLGGLARVFQSVHCKVDCDEDGVGGAGLEWPRSPVSQVGWLSALVTGLGGPRGLSSSGRLVHMVAAGFQENNQKQTLNRRGCVPILKK